MKTKFCLYCNEKIKKSWNSCPNCGTIISESAPQKLPKINPFKIRFKNPNKHVNARNLRDGNLEDDHPNILGYFAILFGILGLVIRYGLGVFLDQLVGVILGIIFSILAMIFGGIPLYKGEINKVALAGLILGGINIVLFLFFMPIFWNRF